MGSLILVGALEHGFLMGYIGVFNGIEWDIIINNRTMEFYDCPYIGNVIIPTDELIFFRGVGLNHRPVLLGEQFTK